MPHNFLNRLRGAAVFCCIPLLVGCYKGVSVNDDLRVMQTEVSSSRRFAMLVQRSDHAALSGNTYFVIVSDREIKLHEMRRRLYDLNAVFVSGLGKLTLSWSAPNRLIVRCDDCEITKNLIEKQTFAQDGVEIIYTGFPQ